jgi:hypothetical protein
VSDGLNIQIAAAHNAAKAISGVALQDGFRLELKELVDACERAVSPGLMALRSNVMGIRRVSGRLASSPAIVTKYYRRKRTGVVATALVGYRKGAAPHSRLVEFGTGVRLSRKGNRGKAPAQKPLARAFDSTKSTMESKLSAELQRLIASKAARVL